MVELPRSWDSLEDHPPLRELTDGELRLVQGVVLPKTILTPVLANDLITIFAKAVGYETEKQIGECMRTVGYWDYDSKPSKPLESDGVIDIGSMPGRVIAWRIGSPDWPHTKLIIQEDSDSRDNLRASISPNTHYEEKGYPERDISIMVYFAEMAAGFLAREAHIK